MIRRKLLIPRTDKIARIDHRTGNHDRNWGSEPHDTIKVARLAILTGLFPLFEAEFGEIGNRTPIRKKAPVEEYLRLQKRFAHLFSPSAETERIATIQAIADHSVRKFALPVEG
jgi:pyruvate ferredoxin oxidoreductase beta subunit